MLRLLSCIIPAIGLALAPAAGQNNGTISIRTIPTVVAGLPCPAEYKANGPVLIVESSIHNTLVPTGFTFTRDGSEYEFSPNLVHSSTSIENVLEPTGDDRAIPAKRAITDRIPAAPTTVGAGTFASFLCDLSHHRAVRTVGGAIEVEPVPMEDFQPGHYLLGAPDAPAPVTFSSQTIQIIAPNPTESALITRVLQKKEAVEASQQIPATEETRWLAIVRYRSEILDGIDLKTLSPAGRTQLQYFLILSRLVNEDKEISQLQISEEELTGLWEGYSVPVLILQLEIAVARGDVAARDQLRQQILSKAPNLTHLLDQIDAGGGPIHIFRALSV